MYKNQEYQNSSLSLTTNCYTVKTSRYLSKIILKSHCKHVPADGVVHVQNKCEMRFIYWGGGRKKM